MSGARPASALSRRPGPRPDGFPEQVAGDQPGLGVRIGSFSRRPAHEAADITNAQRRALPAGWSMPLRMSFAIALRPDDCGGVLTELARTASTAASSGVYGSLAGPLEGENIVVGRLRGRRRRNLHQFLVSLQRKHARVG